MFELEVERDGTVWFIADKTDPRTGALENTLSTDARNQLQVLRRQYVRTNKMIGSVRAGLGAIGSDFPPGMVQDAQSILPELRFIPSMREAALSSQASAIDLIVRYSGAVEMLLGFEDQIALTRNDPQLTLTVVALNQISRVEEEYSIQRCDDRLG
jgi:hypothetical protein